MEEILKSHPVKNLRMEIAKTNIKGYSKLKKAEVVKLMLKNKEKFKHIKYNEEKFEREDERRMERNKLIRMELNFLNDGLSLKGRKERLTLKKYKDYKLVNKKAVYIGKK